MAVLTLWSVGQFGCRSGLLPEETFRVPQPLCSASFDWFCQGAKIRLRAAMLFDVATP